MSITELIRAFSKDLKHLKSDISFLDDVYNFDENMLDEVFSCLKSVNKKIKSAIKKANSEYRRGLIHD